MEYKDKEKRKQYLIDYRNKNRKKLRNDSREYYKKIGTENWRKKYYKYSYSNTLNNKEKLLGTSGIGRKYEKLALKLLTGSIDCNKNSFSGKWDIEWNGMKIDVKMRNKRKTGSWGFTTKPNPKADYFLCFCIDKNRIKYIYYVPAEIFKQNLTISENGRYNKYLLKLNQEG